MKKEIPGYWSHSNEFPRVACRLITFRIDRCIAAYLLIPILAAAPVKAAVVSLDGSFSSPANLTDVVAVATGEGGANLALRRNGTVVPLSGGPAGTTDIPPGLSNVVAIASGWWHSLALRSDGTVVAWGNNFYNQLDVPPDLTNAVAIAAGEKHSIVLRADGTVVLWGTALYPLPAGATNIVGISAHFRQSLVVKADGTVLAWGDDAPPVPEDLSDVAAVAAGRLPCSYSGYSMALKRDGTVVAWGDNCSGQCDVPVGLSNVVAISPMYYSSMALKKDSTIVMWPPPYSPPAGLTNVVQISDGAALVGEGAPFLAQQPVNQTTWSGNPIQLRTIATGSLPLSYQWRLNGHDVLGATEATLVLDNPQPIDAGVYALVVSNAFGVATSTKATVTVLTGVAQLVLADVAAYPGKLIKLQPSVVGSQPVSYQWRFNGANLAGATERDFIIASITPQGSGQYSVVASNRFGTSTATASVWVSPAVSWPGEFYPPTGLTDLVAVASTEPGMQLTFAAIQRNGTVVSWDANRQPVVLPRGLTNLQSIAAGTSHFLGLRQDGTVVAWTPPNVSAPWLTNVPAGLSNVVAISVDADLDTAVKADGTVTAWQNFPGTVPDTSGLSNIVATASNLALKDDGTVVAWGNNASRNPIPAGLSNVVALAADETSGIALQRDGRVTGWGSQIMQNMPLVTNAIAVALGNNGSLGLILNQDGTIPSWTTSPPPGLTNGVSIFAQQFSEKLTALAENIAPFLSVRPRNRTIPAGESVTFRARAIGSPTLRYQWKFSGQDLPGATGTALTLDNVQSKNGGTYAVSVSNALGSASASFKLSIAGAAPLLTSQPQDQTVSRGTTATFAVAAQGSEPFHYQWKFNGTKLTGATSSTIVLKNVQATNGGTYQVTVTNSFGSATSLTATLVVVIPVGDALNTTGLLWNTGGNAPWVGESLVTHDGVDAAQSGHITDNQQSILETSMVGPGSVSFWWKVSSEQFYDVLTFSISGVEQARISGQVDWQQKSFVVPSGPQTLQWIYVKDGGTSVGQDTAWLDQVSYTGGGSPPLLTQSSLQGTTFETLVQSINGEHYVLESRNSLSTGNWSPVMTAIGDGTILVLSDTNAVPVQRFYRVQQTN